MAKQSTLSGEERSQLVLRLLSKEEAAAQIARRAGVSEQSLYRWRDEFLSGGKQALAGRGADREQAKALRQLKSALAERDQVIGELTIANRILKNSRAGRADGGGAHHGHRSLCGQSCGSALRGAEGPGHCPLGVVRKASSRA
jgi:transposase